MGARSRKILILEVLRVVFPNPAQSVENLRKAQNAYRGVADLMEAAAGETRQRRARRNASRTDV